ncbi:MULTISPECIES: phosphatidate cytidylyltransferase [Sphingomonas]|uniref:phosphatidate cytidylyltransferase n=1 Tax=Sphingomonas TaxID=13687 RepID=UPI0008367E59|nr:phosphatidate cytidylyltransferase [Sphingomonas sp. CCH10-B3]
MTDAPRARQAELATRVVAGAAMIAVALGGLWLGGAAFWILCTALALGVLREWALLLGAREVDRRLMLFAMVVPLAIMSPWAAGPSFRALGFVLGAALFILGVSREPARAAGLLYAGLPVLALLLIRDEPRGLLFGFWTLALVWACDMGAFFAGRWLGGPRLAPAISPNKTWAGLIGGVAAAGVLAAALHAGYGLPWRLTLATPALAIASQGGDLFESWLKRRAGVKDSGTLLPGHGGLLDRLDGLVPVAPLAALLVMLPHVRGWML